jgi:4-aminobutyrate aminotransferase/(S)-3-amino-2-methylpropionate transaminase
MSEQKTATLQERRQEAVPRGPFNVGPVFVERAEGALLWDVEGKRYIDFCGGIGVANVGHCHPSIVRAVQEQAGRYLHTCWHVAMYEPYLRLAERLNALVPIEDPCMTALFNSGAEATENAIKIARIATGRPAVVAFERGFHGRTLMGMTLTGKVKPYSAGFGPFAPEVYRLPFGPFFDPPRGASEGEVACEAQGAIDRLFQYHVEPASISCVIVEPVLGEGGFYPVHSAALRMLHERARAEGIVFIADEVQSGFGRCGALFAIERFGLEPDLITMAKSLGGGLPLSAVTGRSTLMDAPHVGGIGGTFGGNPLACAAANAVLDVFEEEGLAQRAASIGERVMQTFDALRDEVPAVGDARGLGAMCALEIVDPGTGLPSPELANRVVTAARERGLLLMTASGNVIRTLMPLVVRDEELEEALEVLSAVVRAL